MAEFFNAISAEKAFQLGLRLSVTTTGNIDQVALHSDDAIDVSWLTLGLF